MECEAYEQYEITDYHRLDFLGDSIHELFTTLLQNITTGVGIFELNETAHALYLNEAFFSCTGYSKEEYLTHKDDAFCMIHPDDAEAFQQQITQNMQKGCPTTQTVRGYTREGNIGWLQICAIPLTVKLHDNPIYLAIITDITDAKKTEDVILSLQEANANLKSQEERYKILEATSQGLLFEYFPATDTMVFSYNFPNNKKRKEITNYSESLKTSPLVHSSHIEKFKAALFGACEKDTEGNLEYLSAVSGGGYRWHATYYKSLIGADGTVLSVVGRIRDIHEAKLEREKLNYKADIDGLTGLYRREAAFDKMQEYVNESPNSEFYFVILDLDDFKQINDQFGHQFGDEVLKKTATELEALFCENSICGRFGGDEFLILTRNIPYKEVYRQLDILKDKIRFCAGIVPWKNGENINVIFDRADHAMYHVKSSDKNGIYFME